MVLKGRSRYLLWQYGYEISYWIVVFLVFAIIRFGGSENSIKNIVIFYDQVNMGAILGFSSLFGAILGTSLATLRLFFQRNVCKKMSMGLTILIGTTMQVLVFLSLQSLFLASRFLSLGYSFNNIENFFSQEFHASSLIILTVVFIYASVQFSLLLEADKKLGISVLRSIVLGRYHIPKQENRIFMFLDLRSSTKIAEKLGHVVYSRLLQEIYKLLTDLVIDFKAEIYQFVGDEVVLTWHATEGHQNDNTLRFFYGFQAALLARQSYFEANYNVKPEFKAGVHEGLVSVAEVGEISTQIAYHGDVVNTTARIQELCNYYQTNLLISQRFVDKMEVFPVKLEKNAAEISLRGRVQPVTLYTIDESATINVDT